MRSRCASRDNRVSNTKQTLTTIQRDKQVKSKAKQQRKVCKPHNTGFIVVRQMVPTSTFKLLSFVLSKAPNLVTSKITNFTNLNVGSTPSEPNLEVTSLGFGRHSLSLHLEFPYKDLVEELVSPNLDSPIKGLLHHSSTTRRCKLF